MAADIPLELLEPSTQPRLMPMINRLQPSPETIVLLLAFLVGGGAGLGVVGFRYLIEWVHHLLLVDVMGQIATFGIWTLACVPILGGIIVALMRWRLQEFGQGLTALIAAVQSAQELPVLRPIAKAIAAAVSLGAGASLGPEGPSVELGANLGALLGQSLQVSQERQRLLLGAGAAAGLAAGFNAPIAGVFFALEVVLGTTFAASAASVVLLAAVVAALVAQIGLGARPAFSLPVYEVRSPLELPLYLGLGVFASLVSIGYTELNQWMQKCFRGEIAGLSGLGQIPRQIQPILGGAIIGVTALWLPQIMGIGYETVEAMLRDAEFSLLLLVALLGGKMLLTAISLGSGLVGGLFAPAMFLGATLGAIYGKLLPLLLPMFADQIAAPPAYAMVGMAAVLAASARAPLTAVLLLFELTRDYRIVLPLMAAVSLSVWLAERLKPKRDGGVAERPVADPNPELDPNQAILQRLTVVDVMQADYLQLLESLPVVEAGIALTEGQFHSALIFDLEENLVGIITLQDVNRTLARWSNLDEEKSELISTQTVGEVCTRNLLYAYLDEPVMDALDRMAARGLHQLPVVDQEIPQQALGLLERDGINLVCSLALTRELLTPYCDVSEQRSGRLADEREESGSALLVPLELNFLGDRLARSDAPSAQPEPALKRPIAVGPLPTLDLLDGLDGHPESAIEVDRLLAATHPEAPTPLVAAAISTAAEL